MSATLGPGDFAESELARLDREEAAFQRKYDAREKEITGSSKLSRKYEKRFCESSREIAVRGVDGRYVCVRPEDVFSEWFKDTIAQEIDP